MGESFRILVENVIPGKINILPLLHISVARKFISSHKYFTGDANGNYFVHVGSHLADKLIQYQQTLQIWNE